MSEPEIPEDLMEQAVQEFANAIGMRSRLNATLTVDRSNEEQPTTAEEGAYE